jgi:23S rRNA pseudouridine1911/1915/1917 synthase
MGMEPEVIYEDEDLVAVNKPAGLLVHAISNKRQATRGKKEEPTLVDWLLVHYPEVGTVGDVPEVRPGIVHRLDRDTSGVMIAAKTQASFAYLKSLFQKHAIKKTYLAWVRGALKERHGIIAKPIGILTGSTKRSTRSEKMVKEAITRYAVRKEVVRGRETLSLLEVFPETGRTHQIRVHLASIGHPIMGDLLYGNRKFTTRRTSLATRLMLHALSIELPLQSNVSHTTPNPSSSEEGSILRLEAEPPEGFVAFPSSV